MWRFFGYEVGALIFGAGLAVIAALYLDPYLTHIPLLGAFILTRPLGATLGDFLHKPVAEGGLHVSRFYASPFLLAFIVACILILPQRSRRWEETA